MSSFFLINNDQLPTLSAQLSDSNGYVDLTSGTTYFFWRLLGRVSGSGLYSGAATIVGSATTGLVSYSWTTGSPVAYPGVYAGRFKVIFSNGQCESIPNDSYIKFEIGPDL